VTHYGHQRRRPAARPDRWLLGLVTLVLALGVVVMHSLGIGHHGPSHIAPGGQSMAMAGAAGAHQATHHHSSATDPTVASGHDARHDAGHDARHGGGSAASHGLNEVSHGTAGSAATVAERVVAAGASHGATVMCLAVLPLLVLLRRRGGGAWFARAVAAARRPGVAVRARSSIARPRPPGSILTELCVLRT
jgi:hypothetical protein